MAGGAEVDRDVAHGEHVAGVQQCAPVGHVVGEVVEFALLTLDEGDVVGLFATEHPGADELVVVRAGDQAFGGPEVQDLGEEPLQQGGVLGGDEGVVQAGDPDAAQPFAGPGVGVPDAGALPRYSTSL